MVAVAPGLTVREAMVADGPFLRRLYDSTRAEELAGLAWDDRTRRAFLDQQFDAQAAGYRHQFPGARFLVVELEGAAAGRLYLDDDGPTVYVLDISLLPEHRGGGLGGALLRWVIGDGRPATLSVADGNPARRLYERMGFVVVAEQPPYLSMERQPLS
jgi:ribosomal protein S18 acetylase RimI-like enzyme